jgi:dienelactone hydrolase
MSNSITWTELSHSDGACTMRSMVASKTGTSGKAPGVLVYPDARGLSDFSKDRAAALAELGFVAMAVDIYGSDRTAAGPEGGPATMNWLREDTARWRGRAAAAHAALAQQANVDATKIAAIGFCFGGATALELVRDGADIAAVTTFHGGLQTKKPAGKGQIKATLLVCTGAEDPVVPLTQLWDFQQEMREAGATWEVITFSGTKHSFTDPGSDRMGRPEFSYNKVAAERSWTAMRGLFRDTFGVG